MAKIYDFKQLLWIIFAVPIWLVSDVVQNIMPRPGEPTKKKTKMDLQPNLAKGRAVATKTVVPNCADAEVKVNADVTEIAALSFEEVSRSFRSAFQVKDYQKVLQAWDALKSFEQTPSIELSHVVESMKGCKKDSKSIVAELVAFFTSHPDKQDMSVINELLEPLCRNGECHLVDLLMAALPTLNLLKDQRTYETVLRMHVAKANFVKARRLVAELRENQIDINTRILMTLMTMAMQTDDVDGALSAFRELRAVWDSRLTWEVAQWKVHEHKMRIITEIAELACKHGRLDQLLLHLEGMQVGEEAVNTMFAECSKSGNVEHAKLIEAVARANQAPLKDSTYACLIKCLSARPWRVRSVIEEALYREGTQFSPELALAILDYCTGASDSETATALFHGMAPKPAKVAAAFTRFYAARNEDVPAVLRRRGRGNTDAIVKAMKRAPSPDGSTSAGTSSDSDGDGSADEWAARWMTKAAVRPPPGLEHLLGASPPGLEAMLDLPDPFNETTAKLAKYTPTRLSPGGRL